MSTFKFKQVYLRDPATVVGRMEGEGPLARCFDAIESGAYFNEKSWEQAEASLVDRVVTKVLKKNNLHESEIDLALGGDLVNQMAPTHYGFRDFDIPFLGIYAACATITEAMIVGATFVEKKRLKRAIVFSSSHNNMAEKQFRNPVEYGGPKGEMAQYTATGAGAAILCQEKTAVKVTGATIGTIVDAGATNPMNMGEAMAPAAAHTIKKHLENFPGNIADYDMILTGDLAKRGSPILVDILKSEGIDISGNHKDCGILLYDEDQPTFSGGSGSGCATIVTFSYVYQLLKEKKINKVLVVATGALLNPLMMAQKETIPCIAHAVVLESMR